jgi:hypothetical protein
MIQPVVPRASRPICNKLQRRFKTFVRRVDKNNEVYYTLAKRGPNPDQAASSNYQDFFEMPDIVLDLDGEGLKGVRSFEDSDEQSVAARWGVPRKKQAAKQKVNALEEEIEQSRRKAEDVLSNPLNIWKLTSHDILSAALNGNGPKTGRDSSQPMALSNSKSSTILETLRRENGIPAHVQDSDTLLLEWLLLRRATLRNSQQENGVKIATPEQLVDSLRQQNSIAAIRRLVSLQLSGPDSMNSYFWQQSKTDIIGEIRNACLRVLSNEASGYSDHISALIFIGNVVDRLCHAKVSTAAADRRPLCGLALRWSAEVDALDAAYEWLHRSHMAGEWPETVEFADDACAAIRALESRATSDTAAPVDRHFLLQLLTGLDETGQLAPDSFRALASYYSHGDSATGVEIYKAYIHLLGYIGAIRTLAKEQQICAEEFGAVAAKRLASVFDQAFMEAEKLTGKASKGEAKTKSLDECVALDYHGLEPLKQ